MLGGPLVFVIVFGLGVCGVFGAAAYVGGWIAYGCGAAAALVLTGLAAWLGHRRLSGLKRALNAMATGENCALDGPLDEVVSTCAGAMSERRRQVVFYESALRDLGTPALVCDAQGVIRLVTNSMLALLKKSGDRVTGLSVSQALYDKVGVSKTEKALQQGRGVEEDAELTLWDGRVIFVRVFISLVRDDGGDVLGAVTSFIDLTEQRVHQEELEEQRERMVRAGERISGLAEHVASATDLLSASADDQAQGAQKQRRQTASVATAMEEIMATVLEVAKNAEATRLAATEANDSASRGKSMVDAAVGAINEVAEFSTRLEREVGELDSQAGEIGKIISVINDIADQTNLLALNAAIEAARAGDAGRGFAVVADEVRKLAEKTVDATREVEAAVGTIQFRSKSAIASMEATAKQVSESTDLSGKAGDALEHIMAGIRDMVERVADIATVAGQQSSATEQIMENVEDIATIAEDADEAAGQAASATREMADLARELLNVSNEFREGGAGSDLRESPREMRGILPGIAQDFVRETYGGDVFDAMQAEMDNPVFQAEGGYPDHVLVQIAESAANRAKVPLKEFFQELGRYTLSRFSEMYPGYFKDESLKDFFMSMNTVHAKFSEAQPGVKAPNFTFEDKGNELFMNYRSSRGLFDYFEGLLLGAAELKGERIRVAIKPFDEETARAEIVFLGTE
jgi:methyl-accepting chemotaxis protein